MTGGRGPGVFRRATDRWERGRIPPPFDEGTTWERITQADSHIGVRRRIISHLEDGIRIDERLALAEGEFLAHWSGSLTLTPPPEPVWTSYEFSVGETAPVTLQRESDAGIPRFGLYAVVVRVPFEAGHLKRIEVLDDRTGDVEGESHLVSVGWDEAINGRWWRVDQYHEGDRRASYWLDAQHRLMRSDWIGAVLTAAEIRSEALGDLEESLAPLFES